MTHMCSPTTSSAIIQIGSAKMYLQQCSHLTSSCFISFHDSISYLLFQDSNQFHATCLDTFPPIFYMNDISKKIVNMVHAYNIHCGSTKVSGLFKTDSVKIESKSSLS